MARKITGLPATPVSNPRGDVTHEVSARAIENGFVIRESCYGDGDYKSTERFSKTAPMMPKLASMPNGSVGDERLSAAIKECKS